MSRRTGRELKSEGGAKKKEFGSSRDGEPSCGRKSRLGLVYREFDIELMFVFDGPIADEDA